MRVFSIAIFIGAFLLFSVQPMMGKFILPWFGGGTAVWSTCMLFFQVVLLFGYAYAHWSARRLPPRGQVTVHLLLVVAALACLPVIPNPRFQPSPATNPTWGILFLLTITVGLPYFVLSATGPLMQQWFSLSRPGVSPYPLFALSNAGSLAALAGYSFLMEPMFSRKTQAAIWASGLVGFAALIAACGLLLWRAQPAIIKQPPPKNNDDPPPTLSAKLSWLLLSATASGLMLAVTNKLCLDLTVMPFLWTLPLALYLLSFIWSFAGAYKRRWHGAPLIPVLLASAYILHEAYPELMLQIPILAATLFYCCLICHGEIYRSRPAPRFLTGFYLFLATGGALGGVFVAIIAPLIFNDFFELQWLLAIVPVFLVFVHLRERGTFNWDRRPVPVWPVAAGASILIAIVFWLQAHSGKKDRVVAARSFYGVLKVSRNPAGIPAESLGLYSGTTLHGFQMAREDWNNIPTGYYHRRTGIGLLCDALFKESGFRMGAVGLGSGTLAAYGRTNDVIRFYEINAIDAQIANNQFSFLNHSVANIQIVLGDARLSLEREPPQQFDVLALDAFNSDAIPIHLLTREALQLYERHLKPGGVIAVHVSSRYIDLAPVVENLARDLKLNSLLLEWYPALEARPGAPPIEPWEMLGTRWMLLTRDKTVLDRPEIRSKATRRPASTSGQVWTDEYNSLLPYVRWK